MMNNSFLYIFNIFSGSGVRWRGSGDGTRGYGEGGRGRSTNKETRIIFIYPEIFIKLIVYSSVVGWLVG